MSRDSKRKLGNAVRGTKISTSFFEGLENRSMMAAQPLHHAQTPAPINEYAAHVPMASAASVLGTPVA